MERKELTCPKCSTVMQPLTLAGIELDSCPFCNGCWMDRNEVERMTRSRGRNHLNVELEDTKASELTCPRCRKTDMLVGHHINIKNLVLDQCQTCHGVWMDRGELTTLLSFRQETPG